MLKYKSKVFQFQFSPPSSQDSTSIENESTATAFFNYILRAENKRTNDESKMLLTLSKGHDYFFWLFHTRI